MLLRVLLFISLLSGSSVFAKVSEDSVSERKYRLDLDTVAFVDHSVRVLALSAVLSGTMLICVAASLPVVSGSLIVSGSLAAGAASIYISHYAVGLMEALSHPLGYRGPEIADRQSPLYYFARVYR